ncbi:MAG: carbohydrate porin, partial [Deltaproteobacteria bacterium]
PVPKGDLLGFGFNWGEPNEDTFGPGLRDQYTTEAFFRWQLTPQFAITPDVQLLINPALNTEEDQIWVFGLRARLAL